jgi:hypothetical protein
VLNVRNGALLVKGGSLQTTCTCCGWSCYAPDAGACCDGTECRVVQRCDCDTENGEVFKGVGTTCGGIACSSCCEWNGTSFVCTSKTQEQCAESGGIYRPIPCSGTSPCLPCDVCCYDFPNTLNLEVSINVQDLVIGGRTFINGLYKTNLGSSLAVSGSYTLTRVDSFGQCARYVVGTCGQNNTGDFTFLTASYSHALLDGNQCQDEWRLSAQYVSDIDNVNGWQVESVAPCLGTRTLYGFVTVGEARSPRPPGCDNISVNFSKEITESDMWNVQLPEVTIGGMSGSASVRITANPLP